MKSLGQSLVKWKGLLMLDIRTLIIVAGVCALLMAGLYVFQSRFVYYPERTLLADLGQSGFSSRASILKLRTEWNSPVGSFPATVLEA